MDTGTIDDTIEDFIDRWSKSSGAERAKFQGFAYELCDILGVARPDVSTSEAEHNTYAFERSVEFKARQEAFDLDDDLQETKPEFPTENELAETASVMRVLATAPAALSIQDVARHFKQGFKVEKRVASTMLALARLGHITSSADAATFSIRRT